ncbi:hypothetical protein BU16DRAFT_532516 [Lophium mytilinum]|uniref:Uncharacterized protein n=1 Tax=Lophium mytilinum TaxID=390894 RepID=A0A6A6RCK8_9PEZI|nr:hypothetical protein BU16DRAFT_532516 [Lophium mytilinum]
MGAVLSRHRRTAETAAWLALGAFGIFPVLLLLLRPLLLPARPAAAPAAEAEEEEEEDEEEENDDDDDRPAPVPAPAWVMWQEELERRREREEEERERERDRQRWRARGGMWRGWERRGAGAEEGGWRQRVGPRPQGERWGELEALLGVAHVEMGLGEGVVPGEGPAEE